MRIADKLSFVLCVEHAVFDDIIFVGAVDFNFFQAVAHGKRISRRNVIYRSWNGYRLVRKVVFFAESGWPEFRNSKTVQSIGNDKIFFNAGASLYAGGVICCKGVGKISGDFYFFLSFCGIFSGDCRFCFVIRKSCV